MGQKDSKEIVGSEAKQALDASFSSDPIYMKYRNHPLLDMIAPKLVFRKERSHNQLVQGEPGNLPNWNADETKRYRKDQKSSEMKETWPVEFFGPPRDGATSGLRELRMVIIDKCDAQTSKDIYHTYTSSLDWGDTPWNVMITKEGQIVQLRYSNEKFFLLHIPVGGHTYAFNNFSVGVLLQGNFNHEEPTEAQMDSLVELLSWYCLTFRLDLRKTFTYQRFWEIPETVPKDTPNVSVLSFRSDFPQFKHEYDSGNSRPGEKLVKRKAEILQGVDTLMAQFSAE